jgi:hypothetical protein
VHIPTIAQRKEGGLRGSKENGGKDPQDAPHKTPAIGGVVSYVRVSDGLA